MIVVLAGVNGAGKSSIGGSALQAAGQDWYNPDEFSRAMAEQFPDEPIDVLNSRVWHQGLTRLKAAIRDNADFAFESTLGDNTITNTLHDAIAAGVSVSIWYCGLASAEQHIDRVKARVAQGGHDIPDELICSRYRTSIRNLCRLTPGLQQLAVYDNSAALDARGQPRLRLLLHLRDRKLLTLETGNMPNWAKPVAVVCLNTSLRAGT